MTYAKRIDANQPLIVEAFRKHGCTVAHTHMVGKGFPDLVIRYRDHVALVEVKDGAKPPSRRKLTKPEELFHDAWGGVVQIVQSVDDVSALVNAWRSGL